MSASISDRIIDALVEAWNTDKPSDVPPLVRSEFRQIVLNSSNPTSAEIEWVQDEETPSSKDSGPLQMHEQMAAIECHAIGTDGIPAKRLDPLYLWASTKFNDNRLGGLVDSCRIAGRQLSRAKDVEVPTARMLMLIGSKFTSAAKDAAKRA